MCAIGSTFEDYASCGFMIIAFVGVTADMADAEDSIAFVSLRDMTCISDGGGYYSMSSFCCTILISLMVGERFTLLAGSVCSTILILRLLLFLADYYSNSTIFL